MKADIPYFLDPVLRNEEISKAKEKGNCLYTSVATRTPRNWFFSQSSPSISSVSTEQKRTCVASCPAESLVGSERSGKLVAENNPETVVIPTELSTMDKTPRSNDNVQGNLLHNYEQKIANLPDHLRLIKLCSNVGIAKTVAR